MSLSNSHNFAMIGRNMKKTIIRPCILIYKRTRFQRIGLSIDTRIKFHLKRRRFSTAVRLIRAKFREKKHCHLLGLFWHISIATYV